MFCTHCGNEVVELSLKCPKCGCNPQNGHKICPRCGARVNEQDSICLQCSYPLKTMPPNRQVEEAQMGKKSNVAAGLFAIFLGSIGVHRFYMGKIFSGFMRILCTFFWITLIFSVPFYRELHEEGRDIAQLHALIALILPIYVWIKGIIEGIIYLTMSEEQFNEKYINKTRKRY